MHKWTDFTYPLWYQALDIEQHIKKYAPQNRFNKQDFAETNKAQHIKGFTDINLAIHQHGQGLDKISYPGRAGMEKPLLTQSEVIHLTDVAKLIDKLGLIWLINLVPFIACCTYIRHKKPRPPSLRVALVLSLGLLASVFLVLASFGFTKVFYYLHQVVFPANHQWFFYYQDSLMSTLMKAPDLFAAIGLTLCLLALIIYVFIYRLFYRLGN